MRALRDEQGELRTHSCPSGPGKPHGQPDAPVTGCLSSACRARSLTPIVRKSASRSLARGLLAFRDSEGTGRLGSRALARPRLCRCSYFGRNEVKWHPPSPYHGSEIRSRRPMRLQVPSAPSRVQIMGSIPIPSSAAPVILLVPTCGPKDKRSCAARVECCNLPKSHVFVFKRLQETTIWQAIEGASTPAM